MQPWEYGSLPKAWLPMLRRVDEVWAYSRSVRDCYLEAGVPPERVHVIPLGVDPEVFRPGLAPLALPPGPDVRFLFVGGTIFRKGIDLLLSAFARAFQPSDGVGLVIKDMGTKSFYRGQTAEASVAGLRERGYPVEYIDRSLGEQEIAGLYAACDCLVHPFRGEGFALPVVEAMACGLPVIVTGAGPALDYASEETAFLIPAHRGQFAECRVGDLETIGRPWLSEPHPDALVEHLRRVAADPASARAKGQAASAWIRERFTWSRAAEAAEARLHALAGGGDWNGAGAIPAQAARRSPHEQVDPRAPEPRPSGPVPLPAGPSRSSRTLPAGRPKVSLTMIVRNEEDNLPHCLASAADLFDEVIVVDTGSTDRTREIARSSGARVFDFVWVDDFAAARNAALARGTGDYAFWLDADDVLDPPERERLEALIDGLRPGDPAAYVVRCSCDPDQNGGGGQTVVDHVRLFPLREDVRWTYAVHEQILPALNRVKVPVRWTKVTVRHTGYTDPAMWERKLRRNWGILEQELAERPDDPFVLFNLGSTAIEWRDWARALGYLQRSLAGSAPTDSITRKLFVLIARAHQMMGDLPGAAQVCAEGLSIDPNDAELLFRKAVVHRMRREMGEAEACWRRILGVQRPDQFCSVDQGIFGQLTLRNLAVLAEERSDPAGAAGLWRKVLAECPGDREALSKLEHLGKMEAAP